MADGLEVDAFDAFDRPIKVRVYPSDDAPGSVVVLAPTPAFRIKVSPRAQLDDFKDALDVVARVAWERGRSS
ncbi:MAG: hypothetical protein ACJ72N_19850 [Labedaea sp.]